MRLHVDMVATNRSKIPSRTGALQEFLASHWPQGEEYETPFAACFLSDSLPGENSGDVIVRDGFLLLENHCMHIKSRPPGQRWLVRAELLQLLSPAIRRFFTPYKI